jgi:[CysO sulfur-carrier protein]-S-L-cysteine hydrolase
MDKMTFLLSAAIWNEISRHAQDTFPEECCGVIFSNGTMDRVQRLRNIQNQLHALDPQTYPRTALIAYAMNPKELEAVIDAAQEHGAKLKAFYHSHPNHDAYFSEEDKAFASPFGEPTFPGAVQLVVSIYDRTVKRICAFAWSEESKDFVAVPLQRV